MTILPGQGEIPIGGIGMRLAPMFLAVSFALAIPATLSAAPDGATVAGKVSYKGSALKLKPVDMAKQPECVKIHANHPLLPETVVTGGGNTLQNVVVYISAGPADNAPAPTRPALFDQKDCHYTTHVLALSAGQEFSISNSDPFSHNIHPIAKINREWNRIQPAGTPPFSYSYENEEFIPVKCNIHPWMQGYFVVLKTSHFALTGEDGSFRLPDLPAGKYTVTAWQESLGTKSQDVTVSGGETQTVNFVFEGKP
jgi:plastocyanin